jgi:hypothetical protein
MIGRIFPKPCGLPRRAVLALAAVCLSLCAATAAAAETPSRIDEAARHALADRSIQKTLPGLSGGKSQPQPRQRLEQPRRPQPLPRLPERPPASGLGDIGQTALWVIAVIAGLALLYFVLRELISLRRGAGRKRFEETVASVRARVTGTEDEDAGPRSLLDEADALAARGAFGEAIHLILMHSLGRLEAVSERAVGRSLTAREILRGSSITARGRTLLGAIVGASELTHFGGRSAGESDYRSCREAFQGFATETGAGR